MQGWTGPSGIQVLEQYITPEDITNIGITLHAHTFYRISGMAKKSTVYVDRLNRLNKID